MSLEILPENIQKEMEDLKREKDNTIGCHIKVDEGLVKITIPHKTKIPNAKPLEPDTVLTFSKREVKEFLQDIYTS